MDVEVQQNDASELLEVFTAGGSPTGEGATRREIHRRGLWHQALHCWILRGDLQGPPREVVLQQRSTQKDTFPGLWDASAAGHWRMGESPREAAREISEELGIDVPFELLRWVGLEHSERTHSNGLIDREHHQVYTVRWEHALTTYRPDPGEVAMVAAFDAQDLIGLASGTAGRITASEAIGVDRDGTSRLTQVTISRTELVPYPAKRLRRLLGHEPTAQRLTPGS